MPKSVFTRWIASESVALRAVLGGAPVLTRLGSDGGRPSRRGRKPPRDQCPRHAGRHGPVDLVVVAADRPGHRDRRQESLPPLQSVTPPGFFPCGGGDRDTNLRDPEHPVQSSEGGSTIVHVSKDSMLYQNHVEVACKTFSGALGTDAFLWITVRQSGSAGVTSSLFPPDF